MQNFDLAATVNRLHQEHEIRIGRSLLPLMANHSSRENFQCNLAPIAFGMSASQLKDGVDRMLQKLHLDKFASVTIDAERKVDIVIPGNAVAAPAVQSNIATLLATVQQQAAQRSL